MCVAVSGVSHGIRPQSPGPAHRTGIGIQRHQGRRSDCRLLGGIVRGCGAGRVEEKNRPAGRGEGQIRVQLICEINRPSGIGRAGSGDEVGHVAGFRQRRETGPRIPGAGRQREGQEQGSRDEAGEWRQSFHEASPARAYRWYGYFRSMSLVPLAFISPSGLKTTRVAPGTFIMVVICSC